MSLECRSEPVVRRGVEIAATLPGAIGGVAERLRGLVSQLSSAECLEARLAIVKSVLRHFSGAVELLFQSVA